MNYRKSPKRLLREAELRKRREAMERLNEAREQIGLPKANTPRPYILSAEELEERFGMHKTKRP